MIFLEFFIKQLSFLSSSAYTLPIFIACALPFYGTKSKGIESVSLKKFTSICLLFSCFGVLTAFADPVLLYNNLQIQGLNPRIPGLFEKGVLAYTACALSHVAGIIPLIFFYIKFSSLSSKEFEGKFPRSLYAFLIISCVLFFISIVLQAWPFAEYPDGISFWYLLSLLCQQSLHRYIESFVPSGICSLIFIWSFFYKRPENSDYEYRNLQLRNNIERFCHLSCIIGLAPQSLMALGRIAMTLLHKNVMYQQSMSFGEDCCILFSFACFVLLLFPRFSQKRTWQFLAMIVYFSAWNWNTIYSVSQYLTAK